MSTIRDPSENFFSTTPEGHGGALTPTDEHISRCAKSILKSPERSSSITSIKEAASPDLSIGVEEVAAKTKSVAAGAGISASHSPPKPLIYSAPLLTTTKKYRRVNYEVHYVNYEVYYIRGKDLGTSVNSDVRALAAKNIPLPLPFDEKAFEAAKTAMEGVLVDPFEKHIFHKVTNALLHITFDDLLKGLNSLIPRFNKVIGTSPFTAVIAEGKSNEWVTQLALYEGITPPNELCTLSDINTCERPASHDTVAIIDDGSYSGDQIASLLTTMCLASKKTGSEIKKFFIIVPFMTRTAKETISREASTNKVEIEIMSFGSMPTFDEVLTPEEAERFKRLTFFPRMESGTTLSFTDWRRPDIMSTPLPFFRGELYYSSKEGVPEVYLGPPLIPDIVPPYRLM